MGLTYTRPEASRAMTELVYALREAVAERARSGDINIAEGINAMAQALASVLVGAYQSDKHREVVLSTFPDVVRAYYPQWEKIYAAHVRDTAATSTAERYR